MKITITIKYLLILTLSIFFLGCEKEEEKRNIETSCQNEFTIYGEIVSKYKVRMEDLIASVGCEVIPIYASIIESDRIDLLDKIEENSDTIKKILKIDTTFTQLIFKNLAFQEFFLNQKISDKFLDNFNYIVKEKIRKRDIAKIKKDFNYINYILLSASYASNKQEAIAFYNRLRKNVSVDIIASFGIVINGINENYSFDELVDNFYTLSLELSSKEINNIALRPQYFAYFLTPKEENISSYQISNIQSRVIYLYKKIFQKYQYEKSLNQRDYALLTIENIYPYLLEIKEVSNRDFEKLFKLLVEKNYIISLFKNGKCSPNTKDNFALFGNRNIDLAIKLMKDKSDFFYELSSDLSKIDNGIMPLFYVASLHGKLNKKQWSIFEKLLNELPYEKQINIALIQKVEAVDYFDNIILQQDYNQIVNSEYTPQKPKSPKYLNVLLTNYPRQTDVSLADRVLYDKDMNKRILKLSLNDLISKDIEALENHKFTKLERYLANLDTLDNTLTVASLVSAPFTGGISLSYLAIKQAGKMATKRGAKYLAKKILNKGIRKVRVVRKGIDNKIGVQGRNMIRKSIKALKKVEKELSKYIEDSLLLSSNIKIKDICEE